MPKIAQMCVPVHFKIQDYWLNVKFQGNWNGFEKPKKSQKMGMYPRVNPVVFIFWQNLLKDFERTRKLSCDTRRRSISEKKGPVILFYLRPWQSLRQNSTIPEILEEFLIQWAPKKGKIDGWTRAHLFFIIQTYWKKLNSPQKFIRILGMVRWYLPLDLYSYLPLVGSCLLTYPVIGTPKMIENGL